MGDQSEVLNYLSSAKAHGGVRPKRVDTHISAVFLAGDQAWKLKKAVHLPFLDFSDLSARHRACLAEVEVNTPAAPELYLGVVPITRRPDGTLALGGDGAVVDWLVHMRRFDQRTLYSRQVAVGRVDRHAIQSLIAAVWRFHSQAAQRRDMGGRAGMAWVIDNNAVSMAGLADILAPEQVATLTARLGDWLERLAPALEQRRENGRVRQCHGDLHLGNICQVDGHPTLFDAIEFSDQIACIDVFYDLAFLLMDLDHRGQRALAGYALNHYLDLSGDYTGTPLLPLFLAARAAVRAYVSAAMAAGADNAAARDQLVAEAHSYFDAALDYLSPPTPRLLAVGGLSGSGKSRMGRELAPYLAVPAAAVIRTDSIRKQLAGVGLLDRLGAEGYTADMTTRTYQTFYDTCLAVLKAGHSVVADAVFAKPEQRQIIEAIAREAGVPFDGLWLHTPPEIAAKRIEGRRGNVSDATVDVLHQQLDYDLGPISWRSIDTSGPKAKVLKLGRNALGL